MTRRSGYVSSLATALLLLPAIAQASLARLDTTFVPADRFVQTGSVVSVTASGDPGKTLEYRFQVQHHNGTTWDTVSSGNWSSTNSFELDTSGESLPDGNYRLVTWAREAGIPADFLVSYQAFRYGPTDQSLCDYLDGKTFLNTSATIPSTFNLGSLSPSEAMTVLGSPGLPVSLASHAGAVTGIAFSGGTVSVTLLETAHVTASISGVYPISLDSDVTVNSALTGTYTCNGATVTIASASGTATLEDPGLLSYLLDSNHTIYMAAYGDLAADSNAGTLAVGGAVFALPGVDEPAPEGGGGAFTLLPLLAALGLRRRRG